MFLFVKCKFIIILLFIQFNSNTGNSLLEIDDPEYPLFDCSGSSWSSSKINPGMIDCDSFKFENYAKSQYIFLPIVIWEYDHSLKSRKIVICSQVRHEALCRDPIFAPSETARFKYNLIPSQETCVKLFNEHIELLNDSISITEGSEPTMLCSWGSVRNTSSIITTLKVESAKYDIETNNLILYNSKVNCSMNNSGDCKIDAEHIIFFPNNTKRYCNIKRNLEDTCKLSLDKDSRIYVINCINIGQLLTIDSITPSVMFIPPPCMKIQKFINNSNPDIQYKLSHLIPFISKEGHLFSIVTNKVNDTTSKFSLFMKYSLDKYLRISDFGSQEHFNITDYPFISDDMSNSKIEYHEEQTEEKFANLYKTIEFNRCHQNKFMYNLMGTIQINKSSFQGETYQNVLS
jgi:hypothetical protein